MLALLIALSPGSANAQTQPERPAADSNRALTQGQQIASAVSAVTSTAISPLFGVCLVGAFQYFREPQSTRAALPFYSKPSFWIPISILLIVILLKDTIGGVAPLLKKPLDALEVLVVNKAALILIAFPVTIHEIARITGVQLAELLTAVEPIAYAANSSAAAPAGHAAVAAVAIAAGVAVTLIMWVSGHVVDVLCLLSPFPFLDLLLKGIRNAVVLALAVVTLVNEWAGLAASLVLIALGALMFSRALRLSIMGAYFAWDLLQQIAFGRRSTPVRGDGVMGFSVGKVAGLPRHTRGRLVHGEGGDLEFRYRLLGFGPQRRQRLNKAGGYRIGHGLLYPCVVVPHQEGTRYRVQFRLLPRYKGSEQELCAVLGAGEVQDLFARRGWRRFLSWAEADLGTSRSGEGGLPS